MVAAVEALARISREYTDAGRDPIRRDFLVQFMMADAVDAVVALTGDKKRNTYVPDFPDYWKKWPRRPWFALRPRRKRYTDDLPATILFVVDPQVQSVTVAGG